MFSRAVVAKGLSLSSLGLLDFGVPLLRVILLTHLLGLREFGIASALAATYATFEQITDISIHRFVFTSPRAEFDDALASAHALSIVRGAIVAALALAVSPLVASAMSLRSDWTSFAALAAVVFIKSWEHQGLRVAERDYRYGAQFLANLISNMVGLTVLVSVAAYSRSHVAILAGLVAQMATSVCATRFLAESPYRVSFSSPYFKRAWQFGYPLMFNGLGLAISSQGDRLVVGSLLGMPALAVYSVLLLVAYVPMSIILKTVGTLTLAALQNSAPGGDVYLARLRLYGTGMPIIAGIYAIGLLGLGNILIGFVFGAKFVTSDWALTFLALSAFLKIARAEPFTALFLNEMRTGVLAFANFAAIAGLLLAPLFIHFFATLEAPLVAKTLGEGFALVVTLLLSRTGFRMARKQGLAAMTLALFLFGAEASVIPAVSLWSSQWHRVLLAICAVFPLVIATILRSPVQLRESYAGMRPHRRG